MLTEKTMEKLRVLTESAKYDVSCSSSGTVRSGKQGMVGNTVGGVGICHSFADDGRCISLLKIMLTNHCMYDCAYCINRRSNDIQRATLSVSELEEITMEFYRRNYIEGLFLSSGVVRNPDYTMERLTAIVRDLRTIQWLHPSESHPRCFPGVAQRSRSMGRPHECQHRDSQRRVPEGIGSRKGPPKRFPTHAAHTNGCTGEQRRAQKVPSCSSFCACRTVNTDDCRCYG